MRKLDKTETLGDISYVREVTKTDFYNRMTLCLYFQFDSICYFLRFFFELVSLFSKQFNAFKAYILLPHVFS